MLPNAGLWKQIIGEVRPKLVLTTGTAGGIGNDFEVGDVVVSPVVRFDSTSWLKKAPFASAHYASKAAQTNSSRRRIDLFAAEGTLKQQAQAAATIYKAYGRWSSVCSAIVCWAAVAAL